MKKIWKTLKNFFEICLIAVVILILAILSLFKKEYRFNDFDPEDH